MVYLAVALERLVGPGRRHKGTLGSAGLRVLGPTKVTEGVPGGLGREVDGAEGGTRRGRNAVGGRMAHTAFFLRRGCPDATPFPRCDSWIPASRRNDLDRRPGKSQWMGIGKLPLPSFTSPSATLTLDICPNMPLYHSSGQCSLSRSTVCQSPCFFHEVLSIVFVLISLPLVPRIFVVLILSRWCIHASPSFPVSSVSKGSPRSTISFP